MRRTASVQLSELAISYRGGPIVAEDQGGWLAALGSGPEAARSQHAFGFGPHPGDRSPDVALRPELQANPAWDRLSSALAGPHHHLLFFEGLAAKPSTPTDWKTIEAMIGSKYQDIVLPLHVMIVASARRSLPRQGKGPDRPGRLASPWLRSPLGLPLFASSRRLHRLPGIASGRLQAARLPGAAVDLKTRLLERN